MKISFVSTTKILYVVRNLKLSYDKCHYFFEPNYSSIKEDMMHLEYFEHLEMERHLTDWFLTIFKNPFIDRIYLLLPSRSSRGRLCTSQTRRRPSWTASGKCFTMPSLWSSWHLRTSACSTASPRPTACPRGACAPEQVPAISKLKILMWKCFFFLNCFYVTWNQNRQYRF